MTDIDPEGFQRGGPSCICGSLYSYGGTIEPGQFAPDCPEHDSSAQEFRTRMGRDELERARQHLASDIDLNAIRDPDRVADRIRASLDGDA